MRRRTAGSCEDAVDLGEAAPWSGKARRAWSNPGDRFYVPIARETRVLNSGIRAITVGRATARVAGALRHRDGLDSCHTVDALVVATAVRLGGGIIATGDPDDIGGLARDHPNVAVDPLRH